MDLALTWDRNGIPGPWPEAGPLPELKGLPRERDFSLPSQHGVSGTTRAYHCQQFASAAAPNQPSRLEDGKLHIVSSERLDKAACGMNLKKDRTGGDH